MRSSHALLIAHFVACYSAWLSCVVVVVVVVFACESHRLRLRFGFVSGVVYSARRRDGAVGRPYSASPYGAR